MKQNITEKELLELTEAQKEKLRYIWIPKERDIAIAVICSNAETEEFESIVFTVGTYKGGAYEYFNLLHCKAGKVAYRR